MDIQNRQSLFSDLVTSHQSGIYAYIFAIVRNWEDADDVFQSLCLSLWRKFDSFQPGTSFLSWARQAAKYEALKLLARKRPSTYVSEDLLDELSEAANRVRDGKDELPLIALERCRDKLCISDKELLDLQYAEDLGTRQIADLMQRSQSSICNSLNRIRCWLLDCIQKELARQEHSGEKCP